MQTEKESKKRKRETVRMIKNLTDVKVFDNFLQNPK